MDDSFMQVVFVFLGAACLLVPLAKFTGLGAVIGYLIAGVLIGPFGFRLIEEPSTIMHFSEFGVVMMLFIIGLELRPRKLWEIRGHLLGLGGLQVLLTTAGISLVMLTFGWSVGEASVVGMALSLSSTAIAMQMMQERGMIPTAAGQSGFSVLLFQDVCVIAMIAVVPVLAQYAPVEAPELHEVHGTHGAGPQGWQLGVAIVASFAGMIVAGRTLLRPVFRWVAKSGVREMFTALSLMVVVGSALLMEWLSLSAALGTFIAGVVLADCEYRHQLERDIEPFKALLLGLFFMSVGMSLNFETLAAHPLMISCAVAGVMLLKFLVLILIGRVFGLRPASNLLFASLLSQAGEFGFVLLQFASSEGAVDGPTVTLLNAVIAITMALTPLLIVAYDKWIVPIFNAPAVEAEGPTNQHSKVLVLGFGRVGQVATRLLQSQEIDTTIIDHDADQIDFVRKFGHKVFYGDGADMELLHSAGAAEAHIIIIAIDDVSKATQAAAEIKMHFPKAKIIARARNRSHLFDLLDEGVDFIERETIRGALAMGRKALEFLGYSEEKAQVLSDDFLALDYQFAQDTYHLKDDLPALIERTSSGLELLKETLNKERAAKGQEAKEKEGE